MNDFWDIITSLLPSGVEVYSDKDEAEIRMGDKSINAVWDDENKSCTMNGKTLHFKDVEAEIIGTILVPYILQELDGNQRV